MNFVIWGHPDDVLCLCKCVMFVKMLEQEDEALETIDIFAN